MARLLLVSLVLAACAPADSGRAPLSVFAASSLTESFEDLARDFERDNPRVDVRLTFAGSQVLRLQIEQGATADVFASANVEHMQALREAGFIDSSQVLAHNALVLIVPTDNPAGIERFEQLPQASRIVLGTTGVPVGRYADAVLEGAGEPFAGQVRQRVVSRESNVRLVRAKVELGEADAAVVYRTDAMASQRVRAIEIPDADEVEYPIGVVADAAHADAAARFVAYVSSPPGQATLAAHGFTPEVR